MLFPLLFKKWFSGSIWVFFWGGIMYGVSTQCQWENKWKKSWAQGYQQKKIQLQYSDDDKKTNNSEIKWNENG